MCCRVVRDPPLASRCNSDPERSSSVTRPPGLGRGSFSGREAVLNALLQNNIVHAAAQCTGLTHRAPASAPQPQRRPRHRTGAVHSCSHGGAVRGGRLAQRRGCAALDHYRIHTNTFLQTRGVVMGCAARHSWLQHPKLQQPRQCQGVHIPPIHNPAVHPATELSQCDQYPLNGGGPHWRTWCQGEPHTPINTLHAWSRSGPLDCEGRQ